MAGEGEEVQGREALQAPGGGQALQVPAEGRAVAAHQHHRAGPGGLEPLTEARREPGPRRIQEEQGRLEQALKREEARLLEVLTPRQRARFFLLRREILEEIGSRLTEVPRGPAGPP